MERDARQGQRVAAASPLAMRAGVSVAMPLVEAKSLLQGQCQRARKSQSDGRVRESSNASMARKSPSDGMVRKSRSDDRLKPQVSTWGKAKPQTRSRGATADGMPNSQSDFYLLPHQPDEDRCALETLADSLESYSPIVGLESFDELWPAKTHSPKSIFMDVTGLAHLFGDEQRLANLVVAHCQQAGYLVSIAVANTLGQAWAVARYGHQESPSVLPAEQTEETTVGLPVESLRLPHEIIETLFQLGIRTVGQLERLPRAELAMRFGHAIGLRLDQLNGVVDEPVIARRLPPEFQLHQSLDFPTCHRETIETVATRQVQELCEQLRSRQRGALQWRFTLDQVEGESIEFTIRLFRATSTPADVLPLLAMHLEQTLQPHTLRARKKRIHGRKPNASKTEHQASKTNHQKPEPSVQIIRTMSIDIQDVTVEVVSSALLAQHQRRLFDENPHADPQETTALINRLTSRLGASNVVCAKLQANAQPEYSFRLQPLVETRQRRRASTGKKSHLFARPLRLFHPPRELQAEIDRQRGPVGERVPPSRPATDKHTFPGTSISRPPALLVYERPVSREQSSCTERTSERVTRVWGPERIETGWWRGRTTCRDYWRVETEAGNHYWVFRDLRKRKWFVQGEF